MTTIYLALSSNANAQSTLRDLDWSKCELGVLVSFHYIKPFEASERTGPIRAKKFMLDSGAYSAWNAGVSVDIDALVKESKKPRWTESVALDVIGSPEGSLKNALYMKACGSNAFPVFHYGEPWDLLKEYKKHFWKVGLSCLLGEPLAKSKKWLEQCFAHAWPCRFHSFGWTSRDILMSFPFHSADASTWEMGPTAFGMWGAFGRKRLSINNKTLRATPGVLRAEVEVFERLQRDLRSRWAKEANRWTD